MTRKELQTIRDLRGQLAEATEAKDRMRRIEQIACRDAAEAMDLVAAYESIAHGAERLIGCGHAQSAQVILGCLRTVHIDHLRTQIQREQAIEKLRSPQATSTGNEAKEK